MSRVVKRVMARCPHANGMHLWMGYARNEELRVWGVFCSRCGARGVFNERELRRWADERDRVWAERTGEEPQIGS